MGTVNQAFAKLLAIRVIELRGGSSKTEIDKKQF